MIRERTGHGTKRTAEAFSDRIFRARHRLRDQDYLLMNTLASHAYKCSKYDLKGTLCHSDGVMYITEREWRAVRREGFALVAELDKKLQELL